MSAAPVIAIDGPSASGKGTVAARVAAALGFHYLDSGALYRLTALRALRAGMALQDELGVAALARVLPVRFEAEQVWLEDVEVSVPMRSEEVSQAASKVAALPGVREALMRRQRDFRQTPGLVADGRDMGSVVFPDATLKIFLTASAEIRAERRYKQLISKGVEANISALLDDLRERDARDAARSVAPLRHWPDALLLDTSAMGIEEAVSWVLERWAQIRLR